MFILLIFILIFTGYLIDNLSSYTCLLFIVCIEQKKLFLYEMNLQDLLLCKLRKINSPKQLSFVWLSLLGLVMFPTQICINSLLIYVVVIALAQSLTNKENTNKAC